LSSCGGVEGSAACDSHPKQNSLPQLPPPWLHVSAAANLDCGFAGEDDEVDVVAQHDFGQHGVAGRQNGDAGAEAVNGGVADSYVDADTPIKTSTAEKKDKGENEKM
jgi:hypothetical protein